MRLPVLANLTVEPGLEGRALSVRDRDDAIAASTFNSGSALSAYLLSNAKLTDTIDLEARLIGVWADATLPSQSFGRFGWNVALNIQFDPPSELIPRKWKISPFVGGATVDFDGPNPAIDASVTRRDTEFRTGVLLDAPLTAMFGVSAALYYDRIDSNLTNYREHNLTVLGGPTARF
jgi:hypothetical protein